MINPQQAINDLRWAIFSPPLINPTEKSGLFLNQQKVDHNHQTWITEVKNNPQKLLDNITTAGHRRLGLYYETLVKYYLENFYNSKLLAYNQQVSQNKITIGAFDFIYQNIHNQKFYHRESAVKLYLGIPDKNNQNQKYSKLNQWWGPNCKDRLDLKLNHLLNNQINLSLTNEGAEYISQLDIEYVTREIDIKGYLFYPVDQIMPPPANINPSHLSGYWCKSSNINKILQENSAWVILDRLQWLSKAQFIDNNNVIKNSELQNILNKQLQIDNTPILIAKLSKEDRNYLEINRYFITPNNWPFEPKFK